VHSSGEQGKRIVEIPRSLFHLQLYSTCGSFALINYSVSHCS
jgi:hypothetical protein